MKFSNIFFLKKKNLPCILSYTCLMYSIYVLSFKSSNSFSYGVKKNTYGYGKTDIRKYRLQAALVSLHS